MSDDNDEKLRISFVLTGFGPFRDAQENPTTIIASEILSYLKTKGKETLAELVSPIVVEVSAEAARAQVDKLYNEYVVAVKKEEKEEEEEEEEEEDGISGSRDDDDDDDDDGGILVLLHMGVNYKGKAFQLERYAYNDASFRIPDERGFQPKREKIDPDVRFGKAFETCLDLPKLKKAMMDDRVVLSGDPGRFVCNYTYFYSMDKFQAHKPKNSAAKNCYSLFFHVPPFAVIPKDEQLEATVQLIECIYKQLMEKN